MTDALQKSDFVISILPTSREVIEVMKNDEFMDNVRSDAIIIESSTIDASCVDEMS